MITLHHLNQSRSKRIIWLLEELGVEYQIIAYQRDAVTHLAPPELVAVHPLGKSPVIEVEGKVLAESGAITELLIERFAADSLAPSRGTPEYEEYIQWLHFAESSAMVPTLLTMFLAREPNETPTISGYASIELTKVMSYLDAKLDGKSYLVADRLTGADIMMSFIPEVLGSLGVLSQYPNIQRYHLHLKSLPFNEKSSTLEARYS